MMNFNKDNLNIARSIRAEHNVTLRVVDAKTGRVIQAHTGHNSATNSLLLGVGYFLNGEGVLNQGDAMLRNYIPQYISLGTMGLCGQGQTSDGLPTDIGGPASEDEETRYTRYMNQCPGFGADGYDSTSNNGRDYFGLGLPYTDYVSTLSYVIGDEVTYNGNLYQCTSVDPVTGTFDPSKWQLKLDLNTVGFEAVSPTHLRAKISYRNVVPEGYAEKSNTIDVVFGALISTGALAQFRSNNDYIFITEAGLWSNPQWTDGGENGLLAGYRIIPPDDTNRDMSVEANRRILQHNILRVGVNQVVQVIWKIQLGAVPDVTTSIS